MVSCIHYMVSSVLAMTSLFYFFQSEFCKELRAENNKLKERSIVWTSIVVVLYGMRWIVIPIILPHSFVVSCYRKLGYSVMVEGEQRQVEINPIVEDPTAAAG